MRRRVDLERLHEAPDPSRPTIKFLSYLPNAPSLRPGAPPAFPGREAAGVTSAGGVGVVAGDGKAALFERAADDTASPRASPPVRPA